MNISDIGKDALSVLRAVAPTVATAIGGPFGGMAAAALTAVLGTPTSSATTATINTILATQSPATLLQLKQAEENFKKDLADLGIKEEQLVYQDVDSARKMQMTTKSWTPDILTFTILPCALAAFLSLVFGMIKVPTDPNSALIFGSVLTFLFTESKAVISFWLGGVYDSKVKDTTVDLSQYAGSATAGSRK